MTERTCPSDDDLSRMLAGNLPAPRVDALVQHVDECANCQMRVEQLESDDLLLRQLSGLGDMEPQATPDAYERLFSSTDPSERPENASIELPAQIGPYQLTRTIAVGGMGTVYEARHRRLGKPFAFKLLHSGPPMSRAQAMRVHREWRAHGSLVHPNIVGATDAGISAGQPYLVTERVNGSDLSLLVKKLGPLRPADACELVRQAAIGLQFAHDHRVIHRDVKPSNLMLDSMGTVKVLDLGTAQWRDDDFDGQEHSLHGTLAYMAPEQLDNHRQSDQRSDIYSLGCTFYYLLAGVAPFGSPRQSSKQEVVDAHRSQTPLPIAEIVGPESAILPQLQAIMDRLLAKNPIDRYPSMSQLADDLKPLCRSSDLASLIAEMPNHDGEALADTNPTAWRLTSLLIPPTRRFRSAASAVAIGVALVIVGLSVRHYATRTAANSTIDASRRNRPSPVSTTPAGSGEVARVFASPHELLLHRNEPIWEAAARAGTLDGLVLQPAKRPGVDQWQIETIAPRGRVRDIAWSADGTMLAVSSSDGHLRMYHWQDQQLRLGWILARADRDFTCLAWHPSDRTLVVAYDDGLCRVDAAAGTIVKVNTEIAAPRRVRWHPDPTAQQIGVATGQGIILVNSESLDVTGSSPMSDVYDFDWSPLGDQIVTTSIASVSVLSLHEGAFDAVPTATRKLKRSAACFRVDWLPSGQRIAAMGRNTLVMCQPETLADLSISRLPTLASVEFRGSDDLAALGAFGQVMTWRDGTIVAQQTYPAQQGGRPQVAWHPAGELLATGANGMVSVAGQDLVEVFRIGANNHVAGVEGFGKEATCVATQNGKIGLFAADGSLVGASNVSQGSVRTLIGAKLLEQGQRLFLRPVLGPRFEMQLPIRASVQSDVMRPADQGAVFAVVSEDIFRYDQDQKTWLSLMGNPGQALGAEPSPDGRQLVCLDNDATVKIVSVSEKRVVAQWKLKDMSGAGAACWHGGTGNLLITGTKDKVATIVCINPESGEELWRHQEPKHDRMIRAVPTGDTTFLHSGTPFKERDARTGDLIRELQWTEQCGIGHQVVTRAKNSDRIQSWSRYTLDHTSNASNPVVCWNAETLEPEMMILGVGDDDWISLTPAGQMIDATDRATDQLVWITQSGPETRLLTFETFHRTQSGTAIPSSTAGH